MSYLPAAGKFRATGSGQLARSKKLSSPERRAHGGNGAAL
jgi:hypothetical protein